jgi:sugar (pentulose or hexulose) kinase
LARNFLVGIDIGTSGSKGLLLSSEGEVCAQSFVEHGINIIRPGWVEQDPDECYWGDFRKISRDLINKSKVNPKDIVGVGISSLAPGMVPVDINGAVVRPAMIYMDRRAQGECENLKKKIDLHKISEISGNAVDPFFGGYKLAWYMHNEPENHRKTWRVLNADKYVVFKLTGKATIDRSTAMLYSPYYDYKKDEWSASIDKAFEGGIELLPKDIYNPCDIVGKVSPRAAKETGLSEGTLVIAGAPDALASAFGVGIIDSGKSCFTYGTAGCWVLFHDKSVFDTRLINISHVIPQKYVAIGAMSATGALLRWFKDEFGRFGKEISYRVLDIEAEKINPGSDGIVVLPYFMGERTPIWDVDAKGVIFGLTLNHTRSHIYRALLEATGYGIRHHIDIAKSLGMKVDVILAADGGARSKVWRQIVSDITGIPQIYTQNTDCAPFGDAFLAGIAAGIFKKFDEIKKYVQITEETKPNSSNHILYSRLYPIYLKLYEETKGDAKEVGQVTSRFGRWTT